MSLRSCVALVAAVLWTAATGVAADAAGLAAYNGLQLARTGSAVEQIRLLFRDTPPFYNVTGDGTTAVRVDLLEAALSAGAVAAARDADVSAAVAVAGPRALALTVHTRAPVNVETSVEDHAIVLRLRPVQARTSPAAPLPRDASPPAGAAPREMTVFRLHYADVSEVAGVLVPGASIAPNDVFTPQASAFSQGAGTLGYGSYPGTPPSALGLPGASGQTGSFGERVSETIAIDRRLNAVVVFGDAAQTELVRRVVAELDVPLRTVLLETSIVELTESGARDVGIDFSAAGPLATASVVARPAQIDRQLSLQAAIYAAVQSGQGRIVARPRILAQDGRTASILTGDAIPIITSISFPSTGSSVVQQQVQYINVGVNVQIRPQIGLDGAVTSHIYSEVSSVTGYIQNIPRISQRQATTAATIRDGDSLVIGGLIQEDELKSLTRVPFLSDVPLIGTLFKLSHQTRQRTNLYIMVTPHVQPLPEPRTQP